MTKPDDQMTEIHHLQKLPPNSLQEPEADNTWPSGWYILPFVAIGCLAIAAAVANFLGL